MIQSVLPKLDAEILDAVVAPDEPTLRTSVAGAVSSLNFTAEQVAEVHTLLDKNNAGTLSPRARVKLEGYARVGAFLNLLRAKARTTLAQKRPRS